MEYKTTTTNAKTATKTTTKRKTKNVNKDYVKGVVVNCERLNVRKQPNDKSEVLSIINKSDEVNVDLNVNNDQWFKVVVSDSEGYCMKNYINVK